MTVKTEVWLSVEKTGFIVVRQGNQLRALDRSTLFRNQLNTKIIDLLQMLNSNAEMICACTGYKWAKVMAISVPRMGEVVGSQLEAISTLPVQLRPSSVAHQ